MEQNKPELLRSPRRNVASQSKSSEIRKPKIDINNINHVDHGKTIYPPLSKRADIKDFNLKMLNRAIDALAEIEEMKEVGRFGKDKELSNESEKINLSGVDGKPLSYDQIAEGIYEKIVKLCGYRNYEMYTPGYYKKDKFTEALALEDHLIKTLNSLNPNEKQLVINATFKTIDEKNKPYPMGRECYNEFFSTILTQSGNAVDKKQEPKQKGDDGMTM